MYPKDVAKCYTRKVEYIGHCEDEVRSSLLVLRIASFHSQ